MEQESVEMSRECLCDPSDADGLDHCPADDRTMVLQSFYGRERQAFTGMAYIVDDSSPSNNC